MEAKSTLIIITRRRPLKLIDEQRRLGKFAIHGKRTEETLHSLRNERT